MIEDKYSSNFFKKSMLKTTDISLRKCKYISLNGFTKYIILNLQNDYKIRYHDYCDFDGR